MYVLDIQCGWYSRQVITISSILPCSATICNDAKFYFCCTCDSSSNGHLGEAIRGGVAVIRCMCFYYEDDDEGEDVTVVADEGEGGREGGRGGVSEEEGSPKTSEGSVGVEEGMVGIVTAVMGEEEKREEGKVAKEPENEFMLDGFDFSTSK